MEITRIINSVFASNTYLLTNPFADECWLIDIGDIEFVLKRLPEGKNIKGVFLTHTHYDHIYGINHLVELYPDCMVYTSKHGEAGLFSDKLNFSRYHQDSIIYKGALDHINPLSDGDKIKLFPGEIMSIVETPGHDRSCLCYHTSNDIFTGDSFIPGLKVIATFPYSNKSDSVLSAHRILELAEGKDLYPGHGDVVYNFHENSFKHIEEK